MLKALELNGFKSFADRTRFEFPEGITAVVGPNGSGKSNVVDAIKWVLGSQSAKSLRGKEMTDVIFSGARGRSQTNAAEVTLAFDNTTGVLDYDADEVQITRRVFRSGEGEYLINRQPVRLRDIREVFAGTGVSTGAYSIIEQGKVDALLQSSPKERRLIFEEAAGVSRFKLKRQEAARRLERVDQNLLRLSDIVEELDSRLRTVRSQAGRARKYKEESDRLKLLRTQVALVDYRQIDAAMREQEQQARSLIDENQRVQKKVAAYDEQLAAAEEAAELLQRQVQATHNNAAAVRERIAQAESTRRSQLARSDELQQEAKRLQQQLLAMTSKAGNAQQLVAETSEELAEAEEQFTSLSKGVQARQSELDVVTKTLQECRAVISDHRQQETTARSETSRLEQQLHKLQSARATAQSVIERCIEQVEHSKGVRDQLATQTTAAINAAEQLEIEVNKSQQQLSNSQKALRGLRQHMAQSQSESTDLQARLTGAKARATVLEELERRLDGLSAGAKEVLRLSREQPNGPFAKVRGLVADLLRVDADTASLVETALGQMANFLVIEQVDQTLLDLQEKQWAGRTSFLRLDVPIAASAVDRIDLSGEPGVIGRADQFVESPPDLAGLSRRLLGRHWFVEDLRTAVRLAGGVGRGLNYVTVVGETVSADGSLTVGPRQSATGLLSRRSELRALVDEIAAMDERVVQLSSQNSDLEAQIETAEAEHQVLAKRHEGVAQRHNEAKLKTESYQQRLDEANARWEKFVNEQEAAQSQATQAEIETTTYEQQLAELRAGLTELDVSIQSHVNQATELEAQVDALQSQLTDQRVALARCEQRRDGLLHQTQQLHRDHAEHDRALAETRERESESRQQHRQLEQSILTLSSNLAEWYHEKEQLVEALRQHDKHHEDQRQQRSVAIQQVDQLRDQLLKSQTKLQRVELSVQQFEHRRTDLLTRMKDDYDLELAVLATSKELQPDPSSVDLSDRQSEARQAVDREIELLKQKLQGIGPVNLEALSELEAVEDRHSALAEQYHDLRNAKAKLEQLVTQINTESRQMFLDSLDVIRRHFQELFGSLFGGGEADILLDVDEPEAPAPRAIPDANSPPSRSGLTIDPLECGIEIVARPPGKQLRSISLLSGGERTMTCVALLLAIFKSRPSPFCVLDEVDAALDEANIDRFVEVLKQFMSSTQFVVVTHSKRTMSCADTLYGVTMQESGVSKRVSVRFEDVTADGHIRQAA